MIRFSKFIWLYFLISACVLIPGTFSIMRYGFKKSVDFTGGTLIEVRFSADTGKSVAEESAKKANIAISSMAQSGANQYMIRFASSTDESIASFSSTVASLDKKSEILRKDTVGPVVGKELLTKAVGASVVAIIAILLYVGYAFKDYKFGVSAIIALFHDMLVMFCTFSLLGHFLGVEIDTLFVTAFLTTMSFSVHDTIVIFDRIREYRRRDTKTPFEVLSDRALTETMGRSLVNSFTIIFMLLSLVLMGGESVRWFAVALLIGTVTGTYSSPFIATPVLILWDRYEQKKRIPKISK
jgi:preprotein translocase subunit SecF